MAFKHEDSVTEYKVKSTIGIIYKTATKGHIEMYSISSGKGKHDSSYISYYLTLMWLYFELLCRLLSFVQEDIVQESVNICVNKLAKILNLILERGIGLSIHQ